MADTSLEMFAKKLRDFAGMRWWKSMEPAHRRDLGIAADYVDELAALKRSRAELLERLSGLVEEHADCATNGTVECTAADDLRDILDEVRQ